MGKPFPRPLVGDRESAVLHGHHHVYVAQTPDGVAYQGVPQPSEAASDDGERLAAEAG